MKILISGGAGFIGSNLVDFLLEKNHEIVVIDNLSTGKKDNLINCLSEIEFIENSIEFLDLSLLENIDIVVHLAAQTSVPISIENFKNSSTTNLLSTISIMDYCKSNAIPLVYASSSAIYGDIDLGDDCNADVDLLSPYAVDKYISELYAEVAHKLYSLSSVGLRFFNVYGPRQDPSSPYSGVISIFIENLLNQKPIQINGGHQTRDFIFVKDVVSAIYQAIQILTVKNISETINILTGRTISIEDLADMISKTIGQNSQKIYKPLPKGDPIQSNGTTQKMIDILELDLDSMTSVNDGINKTISFIKANQNEG